MHIKRSLQNERAINEVNDLREYNNFEMYQQYYFNELNHKMMIMSHHHRFNTAKTQKRAF